MGSKSTKLILLLVGGFVVILIIAAAGLFIFNQVRLLGEPTEPAIVQTNVPEVEIPAVDDLAARNALQIVEGALNGYAQSPTLDNCAYIAYLIQSLRNATPGEAYRGSYEQIINQSQLIVDVCSADPMNPDAASLAASTADLASEARGIALKG
jgi:hypothetical protein